MFDFPLFLTGQSGTSNISWTPQDCLPFVCIAAILVATVVILFLLKNLLNQHRVIFGLIIIFCGIVTFYDCFDNIFNEPVTYSSNSVVLNAQSVAYLDSSTPEPEATQATLSKSTGTFLEPPQGVSSKIAPQQNSPKEWIKQKPETSSTNNWKQYPDNLSTNQESLSQNSVTEDATAQNSTQTKENETANNNGQPADYQASIEQLQNPNVAETSLDILQPQSNKTSIPNINSIPAPLETTPRNSSQNILPISDLFSQEMRNACEKVRPSVVHIEARVYSDEKRQSSKTVDETGCGVLVILEQKGYIITNGHVAGQPVSKDSISIHLANKQIIHPVKVLYCKEFDIALLEIKLTEIEADLTDKNAEVSVAQLGNSDDVRFLDCVMSIGSPFGLDGSVSQGYISSQRRRDIVAGGNQNQIQKFFQTNSPANPGNSGGPLFNMNGEVIGIITAIASQSGVNEGVTFAMPINNVTHITKQLVKNGSYARPYIGLELDSEFKPKMNLYQGQTKPGGTQVNMVYDQSPAASAGLHRGDIILKYNNIEIEDDLHFVQLVALSEINQQPEIMVLRQGKLLIVKPLLVKKS